MFVKLAYLRILIFISFGLSISAFPLPEMSSEGPHIALKHLQELELGGALQVTGSGLTKIAMMANGKRLVPCRYAPSSDTFD